MAMLLFSMLVAGSFSLGSLVANEIAPAALNSVRFVVAAVLIGGLVAARGGVPRAAFAAPWRYLAMGGLFALYFVLMFEGLKTAAPVSAAAVFTMTPVLAAGFGWLLMRQILTRRMALALGIGAVGALWVIFRADLGALLAFRIGTGELIYLVGVAAHAFYTPLVARLNRGESALVFTFGTLIGGALLLVTFGWGAIRATDWATLPGIVWLTIFYTSVVATAVTFVLVQFAALRLPAAKVMAYTYLVPSWVTLWELAMGNTVPGLLVLGGVGMTALALVLLLEE
ncbi:MAG: DMT family transporter [Halocynthiibacter sp.]